MKVLIMVFLSFLCARGRQNFKHFPTFVERLRGLCGESVVKVMPHVAHVYRYYVYVWLHS